MAVNVSFTKVSVENEDIERLFVMSTDPALPWIYFTVSVASIIMILTIVAFWYFKRVGLEAQLKAMNWIIEPDDLFSMEEFGMKYKQVKRDRHKVRHCCLLIKDHHHDTLSSVLQFII